MEELGLAKVLDGVVISGTVGFRKRNPKIIEMVRNYYPEVKNHEMFMIGDSIIECAHNAGMRSIYYAYNPKDKSANYKSLPTCLPDFTILDFRQLPYILEVMNKDAKYLENQKYIQDYRSHLKELPSGQRIRVGLLQDGDGTN